jgi:hypothetical protein
VGNIFRTPTEDKAEGSTHVSHHAASYIASKLWYPKTPQILSNTYLLTPHWIFSLNQWLVFGVSCRVCLGFIPESAGII